MNTNLAIPLTNEERAQIGKILGLGHMITRKELREAIQRHVKYLIEGKEIELATDEEVEEVTGIKPKARGDRDVCGFVPSRGDEAYLTRPRDPELAATCSRILDDVAIVEAFAWETIERNSK